MEASVIIAKLLGPVLVIATLAALANLRSMEKVIKDIVKSPSAIYLLSLLRVVIGITIVAFHNIWTGALDTIISAFGWLVLVAGIVGLFA